MQNTISSFENEAFVILDEAEVPDIVSVSGGDDVAGEWENSSYKVLTECLVNSEAQRRRSRR